MRKAPTYRVASNPVSVEPGSFTVLFAGESQTAPSHRAGPKVVDYYLLHHVLSGKGTFRIGDYAVALGAGDSFLITPKELASYESDAAEPWRYRWVAFAGANAAELVAECGFAPYRPVAHTGSSRFPGDRCRHIYETFRGRTRSASLEAAGQLMLLFAAIRDSFGDNTPSPVRPDSRQKEIELQVARYLSAQYAEPVTIEGMAETLGYNRAYLSRLFKSGTGLTPATFLSKVRIDHARRLLRERPELTVEQIASSVGFPDALYFSKQFRRWHGQSPTEYRRSVVASLGGKR